MKRYLIATAFALATVSADCRPSVRMLLLKGVSEAGFTFFTNLQSRKGSELAQNKAVAMCFHWAPLELQVRVEGFVTPVSSAEADEYFNSRARDSRIGAWASDQSRPIAQEGDLERRFNKLREEFGDGAVPRPPHWSGFALAPDRIEFWEGKPFRLHHRLVYERRESGWHTQILYP